MATKMNALDFFANRANDIALEEESNPINDRFNRMVEASERRVLQLQ